MIEKTVGLLTIVFLIFAGCSFGVRKDMTEGEKLFRASCRSCHILPNPKLHTDEQWVQLVKRYAERINVSEQDQKEIVKYLQMAN